jgi:hypothetical protein
MRCVARDCPASARIEDVFCSEDCEIAFKAEVEEMQRRFDELVGDVIGIKQAPKKDVA